MQIASDQRNDSPTESAALVILETYPSGESAYDGLTGLFNEVKHLGIVASETTLFLGAKVLVCGIAPLYEERISAGNTNVIFTTFESDQLPVEWVASINNKYQHCIVSHKEVKKVFQLSGVNIPITVIHNGYRRYEKNGRTGVGDAHFNIGFLGIPVNRKNLSKLYEACRQLKLTLIPELRLHIHVAFFYDWLDATPFEIMKADDMVSWTMGKHTADQVAAWYHQLSCYIFPSSAEGWSYTPRESMYLGIPTIISDIPAHRELVESGFYKVIAPGGREPADFGGVIHGNWDYIATDDIKQAIADMYQRYQHFSALAAEGAEWITDKWKNEDIGDQIQRLFCTL
jgi:glycosyltransferase involved in cell wall biosynthesis